jgi:charged multivesicular body protein 4
LLTHLSFVRFPVPQEDLKAELEALEQEQLNDRLMGAERAPVHTPGRVGNSREGTYDIDMPHLALGATLTFSMSRPGHSAARQQEEEDDEDAQLRRLQAEMAM